MKKYALLKYSHTEGGYINFGDHIQSIAAKQFLPEINYYVDRENLNLFDKPAKIIMNGWFMHIPKNWPPNSELIPLFISFHLNPTSAKLLFSNKENVEYLKKHAPIGCRDYRTQEILHEYGIESYYSFCLTSTLDRTYLSNNERKDIIFNDVMYTSLPSKIKNLKKRGILEQLKIIGSNTYKKFYKSKKRNQLFQQYFPKDILNRKLEINQMIDVDLGNEGLFKYAENTIKQYAQAKLVITSRIHCAIPCIALGTPTLFILDGVESTTTDISRFNGVLDHINILSTRPYNDIKNIFNKDMNVIHPKDINWDNPPKNPNTHYDLRDNLIQKCEQFIR